MTTEGIVCFIVHVCHVMCYVVHNVVTDRGSATDHCKYSGFHSPCVSRDVSRGYREKRCHQSF